MELVTLVLEYWLVAPWYTALAMATFVHLNIYFWGGLIGQTLTTHIWPKINLGCRIDNKPPKPNQIRNEMLHGVRACLLFGVVTMSYRSLSDSIWQESFLEAIVLIIGFLVYYNLYGYLTHRLLHLKPFISIHKIHHSSKIVTPWSGYNVHLLEALIMALTLPLFMLFAPVGVGLAFLIHSLGMMFTTCLHCNYDLVPDLPKTHWFRILVNDPSFHRLHHTKGNVNYGFTTSIMDRLFGTYDANMFDDVRKPITPDA